MQLRSYLALTAIILLTHQDTLHGYDGFFRRVSQIEYHGVKINVLSGKLFPFFFLFFFCFFPYIICLSWRCHKCSNARCARLKLCYVMLQTSLKYEFSGNRSYFRPNLYMFLAVYEGSHRVLGHIHE